MALAWAFVVTGCRDFEDYRTPCKSFVTIALKPIGKNDSLPNLTVVRRPTDRVEEEKILEKYLINNVAYVSSPLNPQVGSITLDIHNSSAGGSQRTLTIHYQKEVVLVSHQCGCTYKYKLNKVTTTQGIKYKILHKELSTANDSTADIQVFL